MGDEKRLRRAFWSTGRVVFWGCSAVLIGLLLVLLRPTVSSARGIPVPDPGIVVEQAGWITCGVGLLTIACAAIARRRSTYRRSPPACERGSSSGTP